MAQTAPQLSAGEQLFVEATSLFQAPQDKRDPVRGLEKLLASADLRYVHATFGLCIASSTEPEVLNLIESYAWCELAARSASRFAPKAKDRAIEVLGRIAVHEGAENVGKAKSRAVELARKFASAA